MRDPKTDERWTCFAEACARLDPDEEQALAEEGIAADFAACPCTTRRTRMLAASDT
jgi:hypothetical protein